jgi:hypothetical protein
MPNWSTRKPVKPKTKEDLPDFGENFMTLLQQIMPEGVIPTGWPMYRRGGSYRHWTTGGDNNYVPTGFTQIGVYTWEGEDYEEYNIQIRFPRGFSGKPLIWLSVIETQPNHNYVNVMADEIATWAFNLAWMTRSGYSINALKIAWLAMGPGSAT